MLALILLAACQSPIVQAARSADPTPPLQLTRTPEPTATTLPTTIPASPTTVSTSTPAGYAPVLHNADWTPLIEEFDGVEMVLVPAGCFTMGSDQGQSNEQPADQQCFDKPFWINRYEVTNGQYGSAGGWPGDDLPRETLTWYEAKAYCESRGARLPTEVEWEYAARGPDSWVYPWGDTFDPTRANFCDKNCGYGWKDWHSDDGYGHTAPVGSYPGGASWVGALDMAGNVWEWTSTMFKAYPYDASDGREGHTESRYHYVLRGGSYFNYSYALRASYRFKDPPYIVYDIFGFRCARSDG